MYLGQTVQQSHLHPPLFTQTTRTRLRICLLDQNTANNSEWKWISLFMCFCRFHPLHLTVLHMFPLHCCVCTRAASIFVCVCVCVCAPVLCLSTGKCVWRLDHSVLLLPSGCVSDDQGDEAEDEDSDVSRVHCPRMLLKKLQTVNEFCPFTMQQRLRSSADFWYEQHEESILWGLNLLLNAPEDASANKSRLTCNIQRLGRTNSD